MNTLGYVLVLIGLLVVRGVTKGRGLTDIPGDLGDMFIALVTSDTTGLSAVLARTGDAATPTAVAAPTESSATAADKAAVDKTDKAGLIAFGKQLQSMGYKVSEHPAFGGVHPVHVKGSQHYIGEAIDVNADTGFRGGEKAALDNANKMALNAGFKTLWQVAGHYDHLHVAVKH